MHPAVLSMHLFLNPFTIRVKRMFQEMGEKELSWDEELPPNQAQEWQRWCSELTQLRWLTIPRWYQTNMQQEIFAICTKKPI